MMTYAEQQHEKPFDWNEFLNKAQISPHEWLRAEFLSRDWVSCACGTQCAVIPRYGCDGAGYLHEPIDKILSALGSRFHREIINQSESRAKATLKLIEKRSAQILNEMALSQ